MAQSAKSGKRVSPISGWVSATLTHAELASRRRRFPATREGDLLEGSCEFPLSGRCAARLNQEME